MQKKSSIEKGDSFEKLVYDVLKGILDNDEFFVNGKRSNLFWKKGYFSKDRRSEIITDLSIETYLPKSNDYSLLTIIECKNLNKPVPVDDIEEFESKLRQIGEHNLKGVMVSKSGFQRGTSNFAVSMGIGLINIQENNEIQWVNYRKDKKKEAISIAAIESKLLSLNSYDSNFFAFFKNQAYENLPELLLDIEVIDNFENSIKYIYLPYLEEDEIRRRTELIFTDELYENFRLNTDKVCEFLSEEMSLEFIFDKILGQKILGKINFNPLQIFISSKLFLNKYRWRFTLAHEIGHLILHKTRLEKFIDSNIDIENTLSVEKKEISIQNKRLEIQANLFASYLLMPQVPLLKRVQHFFQKENIHKGYLYLDSQPVNKKLVMGFLKELQDHFEVSFSVAKYRLIGLDLLREATERKKKSNNFML